MQQKDIPTLILPIEKESESPTLKLGEPEPPPPLWMRHERILQLVLSILSLFLIYIFVSLVRTDLSDLYTDRLKPAAVRYWPNALAAAALLVIAYNLYLFRGFRRLWFGIAEIALAMGLGWYAINKAVRGSVEDAVVILFFSLYLAGRGFVNISRRFKPLQMEDRDSS